MQSDLSIRSAMLSAVVCIGFSLPVAAQDANPRLNPNIETLNYGIYCAQEPQSVEPAPETASGHINLVPQIPEFIFVQKVVPAEIGIGFGVTTFSVPGTEFDPVIVTVTHPPYPDSGITTERWVTDIEDSGFSFMGFSFDHQSELVLGEWTFSGHTDDGTELFHIAFEVVDPNLVPRVMDACFGSFTS